MLLQYNIQNVNWIAIQLMLNVYTDCLLSYDNSREKCGENVDSSYHSVNAYIGFSKSFTL